MVSKIDFNAKNLTSNAGLFLLLEYAKSNGIFELIENDLVFDQDSTNKNQDESYQDDALRSLYWHGQVRATKAVTKRSAGS